ncbi:hypothetical protein [Streptomyces sp. NBC_00989]|nr:hypothetical protein OG714_54745 [Streptomyces sp. NBC_00989]
MTTGTAPDEGDGPAGKHRGRWARVSRRLRPVVVVAQLIYYALCVWREL